MAITRAQQAKQMLQDGGMLVQPSKTGKRPGYRGPGGYQGGSSKSSSSSSSKSSSGGGSNFSGGDDRREQVSVARTQGKRAPTAQEVRNIVSEGPDRSRDSTRLSNIMKLDRFKTFKPEVKTPKLPKFLLAVFPSLTSVQAVPLYVSVLVVCVG